MTALTLTGVAFAHRDADPVLTDVDLTLTAGWTGLVGANGAGKTTLLKLLSGELRPTEGRVRRDDLRVSVCPQSAEHLTPEIAAFAQRTDGTAAEWRGRLHLRPDDLDRWTTWNALGLVDPLRGSPGVHRLFEPATTRPPAGLSGGERKRWQIGAALADDPDVLLVDEPTNHLDAEGRDLLSDALAAFGGIGVLVSHDRDLLDALCERTVRLRDGQATVWPGGFTDARASWTLAEAAARDARDTAAATLRAAERRLADARRIRGDIRLPKPKGPRDGDARSMGRKVVVGWAEDRAGRTVGVRRAEAERAREALAGHEIREELGRSVFVGYAPARRPKIATFQGDLVAGDRVLARGLDLSLGRTDRVHLAGPNGAGKSTLLRILAERAPDALVLPQELAPAEVVALRDAVRALPNDVRGRVSAMLAALGVSPGRVLGSAAPSPGEARKLALAWGLGRHVPALLLDEPTNHLDLPSIERVQEALAAFPGAVLIVTHDAGLAEAVASSRWTLPP